jgi:starvation-inducible outer membrane lipoprotein
MNEVFAVWWSESFDTSLQKLFSSEEKAKAYIAEQEGYLDPSDLGEYFITMETIN